MNKQYCSRYIGGKREVVLICATCIKRLNCKKQREVNKKIIIPVICNLLGILKARINRRTLVNDL